MAVSAERLKSNPQQLELRRLLTKRYKFLDRTWDIAFWITAAFVVGAAADITRLLFAGDWDFWTDWKDRQWWMTDTPFATIIIPSALQYIQWRAWRFPTGATYTATCLFVAARIGRAVQWHWFVNYPINFVWPATWIPAGGLLRFLLLEKPRFLITPPLGGGRLAPC